MNISKGRHKIIAYLGEGGVWTEDDIKASKLTHINYAFAVIKDGKVSGDHLKKIRLLNKVKAMNKDLKTIISIGGWGADGFSDAALTEESRNIFSDSAIEFMIDNNFDGIDLDWEYPCCGQAGIKARAEDRENFTAMLKMLRYKLHKQGEKDNKHYLLTIALGAGQKYIDDIEMDKVHTYLDFINIMTYDMRGSFTHITGHHANLYSPQGVENNISGDSSVEYLIKAGVPKEKIIIGAAFYGRAWHKVKNEGSGLNVEAETTGCHAKDYSVLLEEYINRNGFKRYWDDEAKAAYLFDGSTFISYEDEESLEHKAKYVLDKNIGGIMFWEYSLDNSHKLLDKIYSVLYGY